jgi:GrpB-like predicted nucleotidyltransferase (UPF0157 family)
MNNWLKNISPWFLGRQNKAITIVPYHEKWEVEFRLLKKHLAENLHDFKIEIEHVGSTAINGLWAKPILDVDIIICEKNRLPEISQVLQNLGYIAKGEQGVSGRYAFRQSKKTSSIFGNKMEMKHHLYVCFADSTALKNHLLFRDTLKKSPALVDEYTQLKQNILENKHLDRYTYARLKTAFIISVLEKGGLSEEEIQEIRASNA